MDESTGKLYANHRYGDESGFAIFVFNEDGSEDATKHKKFEFPTTATRFWHYAIPNVYVDNGFYVGCY